MTHPLRRAARALVVALLCPSVALCAATWPTVAMAQDDPYKLHMENGVKLFQDKNFAAALVEFQAAYDAKPSANPLVNVALCEKALFRYPRAIAALEKVIALHGDAMDPGDRKAAEDAIRDMRALLGTVTVTVTPPDATLIVDGEQQPPGSAGKPIQLGPGDHKVGAKAHGFKPGEQPVTVVSGQKHELRIALVAEQGAVSIRAPDPHMTIAIDDRVVGMGSWSGTLDAGPHTVRETGERGAPIEAPIVVSADQPVDLVPGATEVTVEKLRGLYILGLGSILFPTVRPPSFLDQRVDFGAAYGLRVGFQVNNIAGFDLSYEHSSISISSTGGTSESSFQILSNRLVGSLRLTGPGKVLRPIGMLGGGVVQDGLDFTGIQPKDFKNINVCTPVTEGTTFACPFTGPLPGDSVTGWDALFVGEAGLEIDIDRVLIDLAFEAQFQSTGNLQNNYNFTVYEGKPIVNIGPALRIGYRFW